MFRKVGDWILDQDSDVISRGEERHKLERRAMATLAHLADNAGKVVSKDDLIEAIWGGAAVSDHSVAIVISQLRRLLGDDRAAPQYIETIPKRGYRLLAPVAPIEPPPAPKPEAAEPGHLPKLGRRQVLLIGGAGVAAVGLGALLIPSLLHPKYALAVADFESANDDTSRELAFGLTQLVTTSLVERSEMQVIRWRGATDPTGIQQLARVTPYRRIALTTGYVFLDRGTRVISVQTRDANGGRLMFAHVYPVRDRDLLEHAARIAADTSLATGQTLSSATPEQAAPADLQALYWQAEYHLASGAAGGPRQGRDILLRILDRDPNFAAAHSALARAYVTYTPETLGLQGHDTLTAAREHLAAARRVRGALTGQDATTAAKVEIFQERNSAAALSFAETATRLSPSDPYTWQVKAFVLSIRGNNEGALEAIGHAQELDPASGDIRWDHVWFLYVMGDYRGAMEEVHNAEMLAGAFPLYRALVEEAVGEPEQSFRSWLARQRRHGLSEDGARTLSLIAQRRGLREAYGALVAAMPSARPESGVPLAILLMKAGDPEAAVNALNSPVLESDRWLSLYVDRIPILQPLRSDPRLSGLYARVEDFRT